MSQPNQFTSDKAVATKSKTTEALKSEVIGKAEQSPVSMSYEVTATIKETLFKAQNRKVTIEGIIAAFQVELQDVLKVIDASEASLSILEEKNRPQFTSIDGGQS